MQYVNEWLKLYLQNQTAGLWNMVWQPLDQRKVTKSLELGLIFFPSFGLDFSCLWWVWTLTCRIWSLWTISDFLRKYFTISFKAVSYHLQSRIRKRIIHYSDGERVWFSPCIFAHNLLMLNSATVLLTVKFNLVIFWKALNVPSVSPLMLNHWFFWCLCVYACTLVHMRVKKRIWLPCL